jgi:hypothetical protein
MSCSKSSKSYAISKISSEAGAELSVLANVKTTLRESLPQWPCETAKGVRVAFGAFVAQ